MNVNDDEPITVPSDLPALLSRHFGNTEPRI